MDISFLNSTSKRTLEMLIIGTSDLDATKLSSVNSLRSNEINLKITKRDILEIPSLINLFKVGNIPEDGFDFSNFNIDIQNKIIIEFLKFNGYIKVFNDRNYFVGTIKELMPDDIIVKLDKAYQKTLNYFEEQTHYNKDLVKNYNLIKEFNYIDVNFFDDLDSQHNLNILGKLYFKEINKNYNLEQINHIPHTTNLFDINLKDFSKKINLIDFFRTFIFTYLKLNVGSLLYGCDYYSDMKTFIQSKSDEISIQLIEEDIVSAVEQFNAIFVSELEISDINTREENDKVTVNVTLIDLRTSESFILPIGLRTLLKD